MKYINYIAFSLVTLTALSSSAGSMFEDYSDLMRSMTDYIKWQDNNHQIDNSKPKNFCTFAITYKHAHIISDHFRNKNVKVVYDPDKTQISACDMVFINKSLIRDYHAIIDELPSENVLTISDIKKFASNDGIAELAYEYPKASLNFNMYKAIASNLKVSNEIKKIAEIVE